MKNKIYAGMSKIAVVAALATALVATPVLAANGDIWNGSVDNGSVSHVMLNHPNIFLDILANMGNYSYEVGGKTYGIEAANDIFLANPTFTPAQGQAQIAADLTGTPINQALAVSSVSAINGTVTVTFDKAVTEAPKAADFVVKADDAALTLTDANITVAAGKVAIQVPAVVATTLAQDVVYSVSYKTGDAKTVTLNVPADAALVYAQVKAGVDAKVAAYTALADGDLSTQVLVDAAKASAALVDLTGLNDVDKAAAQITVDAAGVKVTAAQTVINDAMTYAELKAGVDAKVAAYTTLADGDLTTQVLVDAAKASAALVDLTGLNDADKAAAQITVDAAGVKVTAAQKVITDAKTYTDLKAGVDLKVAAYKALADGDLSTQVLVDAAKASAALVDLTGLNDVDKAAAQITVDAAGVKVTAAQTVLDTLKVASVSAINKTTIEATLATAKANAVVGDFTVLVDGVEVTPSAATLKVGSTTVYRLTVPTLDKKEGTVSVNGTAAVILGSDFGYDYKAPTVASVVGVDNNHVKIVFSEKVDKIAAETEAFYDVTTLDDTSITGGAPSLATLQPDGKSVLLTTTGVMNTFTNGYIASVTVGVTDVKGNAVAAAVQTIFSGVGTASTAGPVAVSAVYDAGTAKTIVIGFDKAIATPDKTKITIGGVALGIGDSVTPVGSVLTITLSDITKTAYDAATTKDVTFVKGALKDTTVPANDVEASSIAVVASSKITSATYDIASNLLVLNFSTKINATTFVPTVVTFNTQALEAKGTGTTASTVRIAETGYTDKLTLDLSYMTAGTLATIEAQVTPSLALGANAANVDVNGNLISVATTYGKLLTVTKDASAPILSSAAYNATTDTMTLTFSENVKVGDITKLNVYDGTTKLFGLGDATVTKSAGGVLANTDSSVGNKYVLILTGGAKTAIEAATVNTSNLKLTVAKAEAGATAAGFVDYAGNKIAVDAAIDVAIAYTDQDTIMLASQMTQVAADKLQLTFTKKVNADAAVASNYKVVKKGSNPEVVLPVLSATVAGDGLSVILTLDKNSSNYQNGYTYEVTPTVKDMFGNAYAAPITVNTLFDEITLNTSTIGTAYKLTAVTYKDDSANYAYGAGDTLTLTFDGPVSIAKDVVVGDFTLVGMDLGTGFTVAQGTTNTKIVITLGTSATLTAFGTVGTSAINIAAQTSIVGINDVAAAGTGGANLAIACPDTTAPKLVKATYEDFNNDGALGAGDTITLTFDENAKLLVSTITALATGAASGDDLVLSATTLTFNGANAQVSGKTVVLPITAATIVPGTTTLAIDATNNDAFADLWSNKAQTNTAVTIAKSDTTAPAFSNVRVVKGTGNVGTALENGDKIVMSVSEKVSAVTPVAADFVVYAGATALAANDCTITIANDTLTISIDIATGKALCGKPISSITSFNVTVGNGVTDANGNEVKPASGFGLVVN